MNRKLFLISGVLLTTVLFFAVLYSEPGILKQPETCAICHEEIYNEWRQSVHAISWEDPIMRGMLSDGRGESCMHCFAPLSTYENPDQKADGSQLSDLSQKGIQCSFCHGVDLSSRTRERFFVGESFTAALHMMRLPFTKMKTNREYISSVDFCGACHRGPANQLSATSHGKKGLKCHDCHMNNFPEKPVLNQASMTQTVDKDERTISHRFAGGKLHHSMYFEFEDLREAQLKILYSIMKVHIFEPEVIESNSRLTVTVALSNVGSPHNFPAGLPPGKEAWVELIVKDSEGNDISYIGEPQDYVRGLEDEKVLGNVIFNKETGKAEPRYWTVRGNSINLNSVVPSDSSIYQEFGISLPVKTNFPISITANLWYKTLMQELADIYMDGKLNSNSQSIIIASDKRKLEGI